MSKRHGQATATLLIGPRFWCKFQVSTLCDVPVTVAVRNLCVGDAVAFRPVSVLPAESLGNCSPRIAESSICLLTSSMSKPTLRHPRDHRQARQSRMSDAVRPVVDALTGRARLVTFRHVTHDAERPRKPVRHGGG